MSDNNLKLLGLVISACLLTGFVALAADNVSTVAAPTQTPPPTAQNDFVSAITHGTPYWEERYRFENVDQQNFATDANAETLRTILGYKTGVYRNFLVDLGLLGVAQFGGHDFNDGSDSRMHFPSIGDPATTQLSHGNVAYTGLPQTTFIAGRQVISFDNQRWVGASSWRQIPQTFDGISVDNKSLDDFDNHLFHQNRSSGDSVTNGTCDVDTDLFHASYSGIKAIKLIGYSYLTNTDNKVLVPGDVHGLMGMKRYINLVGIKLRNILNVMKMA